MKLVIAVCCLVLVSAAPYDNDVKIYHYVNNQEDGHYRYAYVQSDHVKVQQDGEIKNTGEGKAHLVVSGSFSWEAPNGVVYTVRYTADENGYKPVIEEGTTPAPRPTVLAVQEPVPIAVVATLLG